MRFFSVRRLVLVAFLPALSALAIIPGCADQGEGERCGTATVGNDDDCASGLTCQNISNGSSEANYRCCSNNSTEPRCRPINGAAGTGGGAGLGGGAGSAGRSGGADTGGTAGTTEAEAGSTDTAEAGSAGAP